MIIELASSVAALTLVGIASPDLYRTKMWQVGFDNGFNSNPDQILYAYANYRPIPKTPFVWSQALTNYNVGIAVFCTFMLLTKVTLFILHLWFPLMGTIVNTIIVVLWSVSAYGQAGPDHSDPTLPSNMAWYISKSCSFAKAENYDWVHYCDQAKGLFAVTIFMIALFTVNVLIGIYSLIPTAATRAAAGIEVDDLQVEKPKSSNFSNDGRIYKDWEMAPLDFSQPAATAQPYTPRTLAFNTLERKLPLRYT